MCSYHCCHNTSFVMSVVLQRKSAARKQLEDVGKDDMRVSFRRQRLRLPFRNNVYNWRRDSLVSSDQKEKTERAAWGWQRKLQTDNRGRNQELTSLGSREIKSRWNCGSITCIICFTCVGSQLSISSSSASSFSGPVQLCKHRGFQTLIFSLKKCI